MRLLQCMFYKNRCYMNSSTMVPTKIVLHTTAAANTKLGRYVQPHSGQTTGMLEVYPVSKTYTRSQMAALLDPNKYSNDWNRIIYNSDGTERKVCVNAFIGTLKDGSIATIQTLPWTLKPWGVGKGKNGTYNNCAIQFEICEDNHSSKSYCEKTFEEAAELCAYLMKQYPTITEVVSHQEAHERGYGSDHSDPTNWWPKHGLNMDMFRKRVNELLKKETVDNNKEESGNGDILHTVLPTDTLSGIAKKYNTTVAVLAEYNNIKNVDLIYDGDIIRIPVSKSNEKVAYGLKDFIMDVQRATGAKVDGIAGPETIGKTITVSSRKNKKHAVVKAIQKRLYSLGYTEVGDADGVAGPKFTKAVKNFQKANGCISDGEVTAKNLTWRKLLAMA